VRTGLRSSAAVRTPSKPLAGTLRLDLTRLTGGSRRRFAAQQLVQAGAVESHDDLAVDHRGRRAARPQREQLLQRCGVLANVLLRERDALLRKKLFLAMARRSAGLRKNDYLFRHLTLLASQRCVPLLECRSHIGHAGSGSLQQVSGPPCITRTLVPPAATPVPLVEHAARAATWRPLVAYHPVSGRYPAAGRGVP
jgi:hypothetical protein